MTGITAGIFLTRALEAYGVDTVFGIPGVHTIELYRGIPDSGIRHITPRHEQGAGFMADGYARVSGKPGVCFIISGPGMTNITTAMGQAYGDSVPMLVISAVNSHGRKGSGEGWLHELPDQRGLTSGVTAMSRTINTPEEIAPSLAQAFAIFEGARPRPVHLEVPINVLSMPGDHLALPVPMKVARPAPAPDAVAEAAAILNAAKRPVILAGGGAKNADLAALAEVLDAPVVMTTNARGAMPKGHSLALSLSPTQPEIRAMVANADAVLALGTEMGPTDYDLYEDGGFAIPGALIRVDIDPAQMARSAAPQLGIVADAAQMVAALKPQIALADRAGAARAATARAGYSALDPAMRGDLALLSCIQSALPEAVIVGDSSQAVYAGNLGFDASAPGRWFNSATGFGTLGYGLPAAIGASIASGAPVVSLVGDGGLQFSAPEMASAVEAKAPVILMLYDNSGYGEIKTYMVNADVTPVGVDLFTPDLAGLASASGWEVFSCETAEALPSILKAARDTGKPAMIRYTDALRKDFEATS